jgi:hypothetical protein
VATDTRKNLKPFPPGVSGNPNGAPKGKRWRTIFRELLEQQAIIPQSKAKEWVSLKKLLQRFEVQLGRKVTNRDAIAFRQYLAALSGDTSAFKAIADREEGRPLPETEDPPGDGGALNDRPLTDEQMKELVRIARGEK